MSVPHSTAPRQKVVFEEDQLFVVESPSGDQRLQKKPVSKSETPKDKDIVKKYDRVRIVRDEYGHHRIIKHASPEEKVERALSSVIPMIYSADNSEDEDVPSHKDPVKMPSSVYHTSKSPLLKKTVHEKIQSEEGVLLRTEPSFPNPDLKDLDKKV